MRRVAPLLGAAMLLVGCSSAPRTVSSSVSASTAPTPLLTTAPGSAAAPELPRVDLIAPAVQAVEQRLGGSQQFFEINATSKLVNVIVALNDGALAQNWLYLDGQLTSKQPQPAAGKTFAASALDFDASAVLTQVSSDLAGSSPDLFVVEGGPNGTVRYTIAVTSSAGGQLLVVVDGRGEVIEANPG